MQVWWYSFEGSGAGWIEGFGFVFGFERFDFDLGFGGFVFEESSRSLRGVREVRGLLRMFLQVKMMVM